MQSVCGVSSIGKFVRVWMAFGRRPVGSEAGRASASRKQTRKTWEVGNESGAVKRRLGLAMIFRQVVRPVRFRIGGETRVFDILVEDKRIVVVLCCFA